jgi:sulfonate transport system substrate-binding protein
VAPAVVSTQIPAGTTLRVGDQLSYLATILNLAGEDKNFPYKVKYSAFIGGPPMLQAFQAGALDAGFVGSTPLIFAQAGNQEISAVAGFATSKGGYQLLTAPGGHGVTSWASLKGKKVAYQQGTAGEAVLLEALDSAGLKLSDVTTVNVAQTSITAALQGGNADAGLSIEPLTSVYLAKNPTAKVAGTTTLITDRSNFIIASQSALKDAGKEAALGDYISRLVKSFNYLHAHPDQVAEAIYVKQYGLTPARAKVVLQETGIATFVQLPGTVAPAQQHLADLYQSAGEIPSKVDVSSEFDTRYNAIVQKAQGQ